MSVFDTVRAFVALNVEVEAGRRIADVADRMRELARAGGPVLTWVPATKLHVTLKFFGEIDAALVPVLRDALAALATERPAPRLAFQRLSAFPSVDDARVVFAEAEDLGGETNSLAAAIEELGESLGCRRDARAHHPHLTLARSREPVAVGAWLATIPPWRVMTTAPELAFYRSDLARPGAEYDPLGRFALSGRRSAKKGG